MSQSTSNENHPRNRIEERGQHSPELKSRVGAIAFMLTIQAAGALVIGLSILFFTLLFLFNSSTTSLPESFVCILTVCPAISLFPMCFALFLFRVASAFGHFEPWAYRWVELFTLLQHKWGFSYWLAYRHLYDTELRKAFNQPETV